MNRLLLILENFFILHYSKYHHSLYTYAAILLSILAWLLSVASIPAFVTGMFVMFFTFFTMCCRVHRFILLFTMLMALVCMILDFVAAARGQVEYCQAGTNECTTLPTKMVGTVSGLLWLVVAVCLFKIPTTDQNESDGNEMVGMSTASRGRSSGGNNDVV